MSAESPAAPEQALEEIAESKSYVLVSDGTAYILRDRRDAHEISRFPGTDDGLDSSIQEFDRRTRAEWRDRVVPRRLGVVAIVAGVTWVLASLAYTIGYTAFATSDLSSSGFTSRSERSYIWLGWLGSGTSVLQSIFFASTAILVVLYIWRSWPTND